MILMCLIMLLLGNWTNKEYLHKFVNTGYLSYIYLDELSKEFGNVFYQRTQCFSDQVIYISLFHRQASHEFNLKHNSGLLCITKSMYELSREKLTYVNDIIQYLIHEKLTIRGSAASLIKSLLYCYDYLKEDRDKLADLIKYNFQDSQSWHSINSCLTEINRKYRMKYRGYSHKYKDLDILYEEDPLRKAPIYYYSNKSEQPKFIKEGDI